MSLIILVLLLPSSALEVILLTPCSTSYTHTKFLANFAQAGKELLSLELALLLRLALLAGGGRVFILWKLEEAKQFRLPYWVGVCLCACSFLSMCLFSLSYLWMVPVCCPLLNIDRRGKGKKQGHFFPPSLWF